MGRENEQGKWARDESEMKNVGGWQGEGEGRGEGVRERGKRGGVRD